MVSNQANFTLNCGFAVTGVTATVAPVVTGACPKTISFSGLITASGGPMTVTYRWERSDGALGPTQSIFFGAASAQSVTDTWQLGASYSGWERLHILTPNDMSSGQAAFMLTCLLIAIRNRFASAGVNGFTTRCTGIQSIHFAGSNSAEEFLPSKQAVAGSNPVSRSIILS